jgi:tetratricopeptide (TPR) repeat protein
MPRPFGRLRGFRVRWAVLVEMTRGLSDAPRPLSWAAGRATIFLSSEKELLLETRRICPRCGRPIPQGQDECNCTASPIRRHRYWLHSRETILLFSFLGLAVAFVITGFAASFYRNQRRTQAESWYARGTAALRADRATEAVEDFRTALTYGRENVSAEDQRSYELDLAQALEKDGRLTEARSYLLDIWEGSPGDGKVNLELARLAVRTGDDAAVKRYYSSAIYGVWQGNADQVLQERTQARLELYHYLAARHETTEAQSVLLAIAASLPPDPKQHVQVGNLMLDSGEAKEALGQFQQALQLDRRSIAAMVGAGLASFDLGDDRATVRYLGQAMTQKAQRPSEEVPAEVNDPRVAQTLGIAEAAISLDPFRPGLNTRDRARRARRAFDVARTRLKDCAGRQGIPLPAASGPAPPNSAASGQPGNGLASLYAKALEMQKSAGESNLIRDPQKVDSLMDLVFQMEAAATAQCGPPSLPADAALARLAQRAGGSRRE